MGRKISYKQAINEALDLEMRRDPTVIVLARTSSAVPARPAKRTPGAACSASPRACMPSTATA